MSLSLQQDFLLDSIIFHSISFFDCFSCFVSYIVFNNKKSQWQAIANSSRSDKNFRKTKLAKSIDNSDRFFVTKLNQYRGELIHYSNDNAEFSSSLDLMQGIEKINVFAPNGFTNKFKKEFSHLENNDLDINTIGLWIMDVITKETLTILFGLEEYIEQNRSVPKGDEIIFIKNK